MIIRKKGQYYGDKKEEWQVRGVGLSEYGYHGARTDWHYHENPYFMYVLQGNMRDINKARKTHCPAGSLVFLNWQEMHFNEKLSREARGFHIEFDREWFRGLQLGAGLWEGSSLLENPRLHHLLAKIYYEFNCRDAFSETAIELLLLQLCEGIDGDIRAASRQVPGWVPRLKEILHEETEGLSLQSLSQQLGVHPAHLSRAIPKYLSSNLGEYIRQQKVKQAIGLLTEGRLSLTEIAFACGFSDQSHFTRTFKRYFGKPPKAFRDMIA